MDKEEVGEEDGGDRILAYLWFAKGIEQSELDWSEDKTKERFRELWKEEDEKD